VNTRWLAMSLLLMLALLGPSGCASWPQFQAPVPDVKPLRKARSAQMLKEYEQHRDEAQYQAALSAWKQGNTETCRELIDTLLDRSPENRDGRLLLVQLQMLEQELPAARADADKLAQEFPDDAEVLHVQGLVCEAAGELELAEKCYQRAVEIDPKNETFAASLTSIASAEPDEDAKDRPAVDPRSKGQSRVEGRLATHDDRESNAGEERIQRPGFPATSTSTAKSASSKSSENDLSQPSVEELFRRGEAALVADTPAAARCYFQRAIATAPDDESVAVSAAVAGLRHDQPEVAAELAQSALSRWPKSAALYRTLGMAEYRREHWQPAQAALRQALSLDNSHALSYFLLGCTLSKLGQDQEAERNFCHARQLDARYALKP
jgi:tetratricopeptide (TPR) repeat protein